MTKEAKDAIRERFYAASPWPWPMRDILSSCNDAQAEFIVHARRDVPDLLAEVDRLNGEAEEHSALLKRILADNKKMDTALRKALAILYGQYDWLCDPDGRPSNG